MPVCFCISSRREMCASSILRSSSVESSPFTLAVCASRISCGRRKLPIWSARYFGAIVFVSLSGIAPDANHFRSAVDLTQSRGSRQEPDIYLGETTVASLHRRCYRAASKHRERLVPWLLELFPVRAPRGGV